MHRRVLSVPLIFFAIAFFLGAGQKASNDPAFRQINSIVKSLSEISSLSEEHPVPYGRMSKRQLRQFLTKRIKKTLKPEEIHADELALKMFGLVPQEFDLKKSTIDLLTEQAAAFYDYEQKKLFLLAGSPFESETTTLAHELSHALADQHFDLEHFMEDTPSNDDENLAHTAVVEGQASWLMIAYELKQAGKPPTPTTEMLKSVGDSSEGAMADYPVLKASPLYIQRSLLFPYSEGTLFFDAVYRKLGNAAFSAVFTDAPVDSAQIIHPDRYFSHIKPAKPDLPKLSLMNATGEITSGSLGEFDHEILLTQYVGAADAARLAPHLRGGQFKILSTGKEHKPVLQYMSQWDSEHAAGDFFSAYERILKAKWKRCDPALDNGNVFAGTGDNGYFVSRLQGDLVSSVEGISSIDDWRRLEQLPGDTVPAATAGANLSYTVEWSSQREDSSRRSGRHFPFHFVDVCCGGAPQSSRVGLQHPRAGAKIIKSVSRQSRCARVHLHDLPALPGRLESDDEIPIGIRPARLAGDRHCSQSECRSAGG